MTQTVRLGPIHTVMLMGGGRVLFRLAQALQKMQVSVAVLTDPRHAEELIPGGLTLEAALRRHKITTWVLETLDPNNPPLATLETGTLGISLGAAWIFREEVITLFRGHLLNCHGAHLPMDRGGGGATWPILRGDRKGLSSLHRVDAGIDTGDIVAAQSYLLPKHCRVPQDYYDEKEAHDLPFLIDFIRKVQAGDTFTLQPQDPGQSTYWPRLDTAVHGAIDWRWQASEIERFICAFDEPYPGAHTQLNGQPLHLKDCRPVHSDDTFHPFQAGLVYRKESGRFTVACCGGNLSFGRVTAPSGESLFNRVALGDRLWTPETILERARVTRVFYSATRKKRYQQASLNALIEQGVALT